MAQRLTTKTIPPPIPLSVMNRTNQQVSSQSKFSRDHEEELQPGRARVETRSEGPRLIKDSLSERCLIYCYNDRDITTEAVICSLNDRHYG